MIELERARFALLLTRHLSVQTVSPDDDGYTGRGHEVGGIGEAAEELARDQAETIKVLRGASHALQSYACGNAAPGLARSIATHVDAHLAKLEGGR